MEKFIESPQNNYFEIEENLSSWIESHKKKADDGSITIKNCIFTGNRMLIVKNSSIDISFYNCIFLGNSVLASDFLKLFFQDCLFLHKFIYGASPDNLKNASELIMFSSNLNLCDLRNIRSDSNIMVQECRIRHLTLDDINIRSLSMKRNILGKSAIHESYISNPLVKSDCRQFLYHPSPNSIDLFSPPWEKDFDLRSSKFEDFSKVSTEGETKEALEKIEFITQCTDIEHYIDERNQLEHIRQQLLLHGWPKKINWLFGSFIKPSRFLWLALGILYVFALVYTIIEGLYFKIDGSVVMNIQDFFESLYFSAISMTTIGYGDIAPIGFARLLAATQGFIGVFLGGGFVVALSRKLTGK